MAQSDDPSMPASLGYAIGTLAVENGVAGLIIDGTFHGIDLQMGHPVSILFPKNPESDHDPDYLEQLRVAMLVLVANVSGIVPLGTTYFT